MSGNIFIEIKVNNEADLGIWYLQQSYCSLLGFSKRRNLNNISRKSVNDFLQFYLYYKQRD